jgi:hypothetical protein
MIIPRNTGIPRPSERPSLRLKLSFAEKDKEKMIR